MAKVIKAVVVAVAVTALVIVTGGAILGAGVGSAGFLNAAALKFGFASFKGALIFSAVGTAVMSGVGMLASRGISASAGNFSSGAKISTINPAVPRQIIYGKCRVGGAIVKVDTSGTKNNKLHLAIVVAGHEVAGFDSVLFGDTTLTTSSSTVSGETVFNVTNSKFVNADNDNNMGSGRLARFTFHDGSQTAVDGLANANLSSRYPATCKLQGCAYFYFELIYDAEFLNQIPRISFIMNGKKVYDPRTGAAATTALQRSNPALIVRDYLTDAVYGLKATDDELNDTTNAGGFQAAANTCDQNVTLSDGSSTEKRYTASGFTSFSASGDGVIEGVLTACAGNVTYTNGKFNIFVGAAQTPSLTLNDTNMLSPPEVVTNPRSGGLFNVVKSVFVDPDTNFQPVDAPIFQDNTALAQDTPSGAQSANFKKTMEMQLPFTNSESMAQRLQRIALDYQRQQTTISVLTTLDFFKAQPSDWIYVTNERLGFTNKTFQIQAMNLAFSEVDGVPVAATQLQLKEISADVFAFATNEYSTPITPSPPADGGDLSIAAPTIGSASQRNDREGPTTKIDILVNWTNADDEGIQGTEIQYKKSTDSNSDYRTHGVAGKGQTKAVINNVAVGITYNIKVRHFSFDNVYSAFSSPTNISITQPDSVNVPSGLSATTARPQNIEVSWTNPSNENFQAVELYMSTSNGFTPSSSTLFSTYAGEPNKTKKVLLGRSNQLPATGNQLDYGTVYYFKARGVNVYGSFSNFTSQVSGSFVKTNTADVENNAITFTDIDDNAGTQTFSGNSSTRVFNDIASVTFATTGANVQLGGKFMARSHDDQCLCQYKIFRGTTLLYTSGTFSVREAPEGIHVPIGFLDTNGSSGNVTYKLQAGMNDEFQNYIDVFLYAFETKDQP